MMAIALAAIVAIGLVYVFVTRDRGPGEDKLGGDQLAESEGRRDDRRCSSKRTYDAIELELFRQAAEARGTSRSAFDRIAAFATLRVEAPLLKDRDEELGSLRCSGRVALDLPPGTQVVGGRRTLAANLEYTIQPAADGSGDVVMLDGAEAIVGPLATLARAGSAAASAPVPEPAGEPSAGTVLVGPPPAAPPPPVPVPGPLPPRSPEAAPPPPPEPAPRTTASNVRPSFNCRNARTRGEIAVCGDAGLAALDRQMAAQYGRAASAAARS